MWRPIRLLLLFPILIYCIRKQTVGVKGRLLCGSTPMVGTVIKLWDEDLDLDDMMAQAQTDRLGNFQINGSEVELTNIEPKLKIYHNCNNKWICKRKVVFTIPPKYINHGRRIKRWFNIGTLNMETIFENEDRKCFPGFG